jgi:hypothetical protein
MSALQRVASKRNERGRNIGMRFIYNVNTPLAVKSCGKLVGIIGGHAK